MMNTTIHMLRLFFSPVIMEKIAPPMAITPLSNVVVTNVTIIWHVSRIGKTINKKDRWKSIGLFSQPNSLLSNPLLRIAV